MTATTTAPATTQREIVNGEARGVHKGDSPAVRAQARARIPATDGDRDAKTPGVSLTVRARAWLASWWVWISRPPSLRQVWELSKVNPRRIPGDVPLLRILWHISNWTDRLLLLAAVFLIPVGLAGPLRWITCRPTRRYGFYAVVVFLTAALLLGRS